MNFVKDFYLSTKIFLFIFLPTCILLPIRSNEILRYLPEIKNGNINILNEIYCSKPIEFWLILNLLPNFIRENIIYLRISTSIFSIFIIYLIFLLFNEKENKLIRKNRQLFLILSPLSIIT